MSNREFWIFARKYGMFIVLLIFVSIMAFITPNFFSIENLFNVGRQVTFIAIMAAGMTIVIISGGIDLSVGGLLALTSCVCAFFIDLQLGIFLAIMITLIVGALGGFFNGYIHAKTNIAPFIITLGTLSIFKGAALLFTNARPIPLSHSGFASLGQGKVVGIPFPIIIMLVIYLLTYVLLKRTKLGRYVYAIGGNEKSAILAGINVPRIKMIVYILSGITIAITGVLYASRLQSGVPTLGAGVELTVITAVILGGASFTGGRGSIWGTIVGAFIIGVLENSLNLLGVSAYFQDIVTGIVVILAVLLDRFINTRVQVE